MRPVIPRFSSLDVWLEPEPPEIPPRPPFDNVALQRINTEIAPEYSYDTFQYVFGGRGALISRGTNDFVELRPAQFRVQTPITEPDGLTINQAQLKVRKIIDL